MGHFIDFFVEFGLGLWSVIDPAMDQGLATLRWKPILLVFIAVSIIITLIYFVV